MVANLLEGRVKKVSSDLLLKLSNSFFLRTSNKSYAEYVMRNAGLDEAQAGIQTVGRNINNLRYHRVAQSRIQLKRLSMHECIGEGNGNPLQYSCLENPRDRGAWWAAICGVA